MSGGPFRVIVRAPAEPAIIKVPAAIEPEVIRVTRPGDIGPAGAPGRNGTDGPPGPPGADGEGAEDPGNLVLLFENKLI